MYQLLTTTSFFDSALLICTELWIWTRQYQYVNILSFFYLMKSGESGTVVDTPNEIFCHNVVKNNTKKKATGNYGFLC